MAIKLGIVVVHGMGDQDSRYADGMIREISGLVKGLGGDAGALCWEPLYWADLLEPRERELWRRLTDDHSLGCKSIRKFVISAFGDAIAYQRVPGRIDTYTRLHERVRLRLRALRAAMGESDLPVFVMAHSLGCAILSDYVWDRQKEAPNGVDTPTERLENLVGLVTFGCNLPLFTLAFSPVQAITFPPPTLPPHLREVARWMNYYDPHDVLGYPLKPLDPSYDRAVTRDVPINVGGLLTSWNPLCHSEYWTDNDFTHPVAKQLFAVLQRL